MHAPLRLNTTVLPGSRIELSSPELREGDRVEVIVMPATTSPNGTDIVQFLDSLPASKRSLAEWQELEAELQQERDAWER